MDSTNENTIDWSQLSTIQSFDRDTADKNKGCNSTELIGGELIKRSIPTVSIPINLLIQSLIRQLCKMLEKDHKRATNLYDSICEKLHHMKLLDETYAMGEFEIMRSQYQMALEQLVKVASGAEFRVADHSVFPIPPSSEYEWSRYHREFEELLFIANGGFGKVYKARHRLDGVEYAVKKVFIKSSDLNSVLNHLSEVKTLASLDHPNIVSYKSAWLEPLVEPQRDADSESVDITRESYTGNSSSYLSNHQVSFTEESDSQVSFQKSAKIEEIETYDSWHRISRGSLSENCKDICKLDKSNKELRIEASQINLKWATLYIQMSLCQRTLKCWLHERNQLYSNLESPVLPVESPLLYPTHIPTEHPGYQLPSNFSNIATVMDIFVQLTNGLHYIHGCGIIHHDVKPSNIFVGCIGSTMSVQLGDFGLACPLQKSHGGVAIGTRLYAAPEQLEGKCDLKSDLYSIGIILLEMMESFGTEMEKIKRLEELRSGNIPAHITANCPKMAHIMGKLVQTNPSKRIDTTQLLTLLLELKDNKDEIIKCLREELKTLQADLHFKNEELAARDNEIAQLKFLLEKR